MGTRCERWATSRLEAAVEVALTERPTEVGGGLPHDGRNASPDTSEHRAAIGQPPSFALPMIRSFRRRLQSGFGRSPA